MTDLAADTSNSTAVIENEISLKDDKGKDSTEKGEDSLEDLVSLLFKQMRKNPPEWSIPDNQSEDLKKLTKILNCDNFDVVDKDSVDKKKSSQEDNE